MGLLIQILYYIGDSDQGVLNQVPTLAPVAPQSGPGHVLGQFSIPTLDSVNILDSRTILSADRTLYRDYIVIIGPTKLVLWDPCPFSFPEISTRPPMDKSQSSLAVLEERMPRQE